MVFLLCRAFYGVRDFVASSLVRSWFLHMWCKTLGHVPDLQPVLPCLACGRAASYGIDHEPRYASTEGLLHTICERR